MRSEALELDVVLQALAAGLEDLREDLRVEEEGRSDVEAVAVRGRHRARAAADDGIALVDRDADVARRQQKGGREAAGTSADDDDLRHISSLTRPLSAPRLSRDDDLKADKRASRLSDRISERKSSL